MFFVWYTVDKIRPYNGFDKFLVYINSFKPLIDTEDSAT